MVMKCQVSKLVEIAKHAKEGKKGRLHLSTRKATDKSQAKPAPGPMEHKNEAKGKAQPRLQAPCSATLTAKTVFGKAKRYARYAALD